MSVAMSAMQSRRALLMSGVGSLAALTASALGRPSPVLAGVDGDVVLGAESVVSTTTSIRNSTNDNVVFAASSTGSGVVGSGNGVGIFGHSLGGNGVQGLSLAGSGVSGSSSGGAGVSGTSGKRTGVMGTSDGGIGVQAVSIAGHALHVDGRAWFSRSGRATVAAGRSYVDVSATGALDKDASILAVLQSRRTGVYVAGVRKNYPSVGKARIFLNKVASTSSSTVVAWLVIG